MNAREIVSAAKGKLFSRLREIQAEFDAGQWTDPLPILREHYAVMNELKRRGVSEVEIETAFRMSLL